MSTSVLNLATKSLNMFKLFWPLRGWEVGHNRESGHDLSIALVAVIVGCFFNYTNEKSHASQCQCAVAVMTQ